MLETVASYVGAVAMLGIALIAFSLGGKSEKIGAGVYFIGWLASVILQSTEDLSGVQWSMLAIDLAVLAVFAALVWKAHRSWPVWACALQLLTVATHFMLLARLPTPISSFYTVVNMTGYGIMIAIAFGTFLAWQERRALDMSDLNDDFLIR